MKITIFAICIFINIYQTISCNSENSKSVNINVNININYLKEIQTIIESINSPFNISSISPFNISSISPFNISSISPSPSIVVRHLVFHHRQVL